MKKLKSVLNAIYIAITILPLVFSGNQILCGSSHMEPASKNAYSDAEEHTYAALAKLSLGAAYRLYGYYSWAGTYERLLHEFKGTCFDLYTPQERKGLLSALWRAAKGSGKTVPPDVLRKKLLRELSRGNFEVAIDMLESPLFEVVFIGQYMLESPCNYWRVMLQDMLRADDKLYKINSYTIHNTPLFQAVVNDNVRFLKTCIRHEGGLNDTIKSELLSRAICFSSVGCVEELLRDGVELSSEVYVRDSSRNPRARKVVLLALQYGQGSRLQVCFSCFERRVCDWYIAHDCTYESDDCQADDLLYDFNFITDEEAKLSVLLAWWHAQRALQKQLDEKRSNLHQQERQEVVAKIEKYNTVFEKLAQGDPSDPVTAFSSLAAVNAFEGSPLSTAFLHYAHILIDMRCQNEDKSSADVSLYEGILKEKEGDNRFKGLKKLVARVEPGGKDPLGEFMREKCSNGAKYFAGSVKQGKPFRCSEEKYYVPSDVLHHINGFLYGEASAESKSSSELS